MYYTEQLFMSARYSIRYCVNITLTFTKTDLKPFFMTSAFFLQCTTYTDVPLSAYVIVTKPPTIVSTRR